MFVTAVRPTSRRALLGCLVGAIFLVMSFMAVKDMNDKLTLMTVSNANYQKMTDTLTDKTQRLETEVKNAKQGHRSDVDSFDKERKQLEAKLSKVKRSLESVEATNKALKKEMSEAAKRQKAELDQAEEHINKVQRANQDLQHAKSEREKELREQIRQLASDKDRCKSQYDALYQQFMNVQQEPKVQTEPVPRSGSLATNADAVNNNAPQPSSAKPPQARQLSMPEAAAPPAAAANILASQTANSLSAANMPHLSSPTPTGAVVELPRSGASQASAAVSLPNVLQNGGGAHSDVLEAPAAPPLAFKAAAPLQQPKRLPIGSLGGAGRGVNLDQEVDHDSQDNPELSRLAADAAGAGGGADFVEEPDDNADGVLSNPRKDQLEDGDGGNNDVEVLGVNKEYDANEPEMGQENNGDNDDDLFNDHQEMEPVLRQQRPRNHLGVDGAGQWRHRPAAQPQFVQQRLQAIQQPHHIQHQQQYYIQPPQQFHPAYRGRGL